MRSCPDSIFASLACREPGGSTTSCNWQDSNVSTKPGTHGPAHYSFRFRAARRAGGSFSEDFTSFPMRFTRHLRTRRLVHHIDIVRDIVVENETRRHHAGDHEPRAIVRISHTAVKFSQLRLAQWRELRVLLGLLSAARGGWDPRGVRIANTCREVVVSSHRGMGCVAYAALRPLRAACFSTDGSLIAAPHVLMPPGTRPKSAPTNARS